MKIDRIEARSILDTRGRPTVETTLRSGDFTATASVPSGKSTGSHEAVELRDADGGVGTAVANVNTLIAEELSGRSWGSPDDIDCALITLDGTPNKSRLGANAILSVSIAAQRLYALAAKQPLWAAIAKRAGTVPAPPRLYVNVMNGGVHAGFNLPFQEHLVVVDGSAARAYAIAQSVFKELGEQLRATDPLVALGDEGGYAPKLSGLEEPFERIAPLVGKHLGASIAIDAAATELLDPPAASGQKREGGGRYKILGRHYTASELGDLYKQLAMRFSLHSIEDPFSEDDGDDFTRLTQSLRASTLVVGDDFTVTNPKRIEAAIKERAISAVLIKPNQIGTVMEAIKAVQDTKKAGLVTIASHRSGETMDTFIADFAYGTGAHGLKAGGLGQKERLVKYERLLEIEKEATK